MTPSHEAQPDIFFHPMDAIMHNRDISAAWTTFVLDKSDGFTQADMTQLCTFDWANLGSQAQTRSNILSAGMGFDAQNSSWQMLKTQFPIP